MNKEKLIIKVLANLNKKSTNLNSIADDIIELMTSTNDNEKEAASSASLKKALIALLTTASLLGSANAAATAVDVYKALQKLDAITPGDIVNQFQPAKDGQGKGIFYMEMGEATIKGEYSQDNNRTRWEVKDVTDYSKIKNEIDKDMVKVKARGIVEFMNDDLVPHNLSKK